MIKTPFGLYSAPYSLSHAALALVLIAATPYAAAQAFNPNDGSEPARKTVLPSTSALTGAPSKLVFPESTGQLAPSAVPAPAFPPVDPATQALAAQAIQAPAASGFVAPAPLIALPSAPAAAPLQPLQALPATSGTELSDASKNILSKIPSNMDAEKKQKSNEKLSVKRLSPEIQELPNKASKTESFESVGLSIQVQRPGLDTNFELNRAYAALMGGDSAGASTVYKNILSAEPRNEDALFGLAAIYHRIGKLSEARPYYADLLKVNPNHREGLNNFMALIGEESPQEALAELERLEQRNPDFSPIPAQQALVLQKMGYTDRAKEKMLRAIELSPENLTYSYNLAIMLDRAGYYADASALYRMLIAASLKGEKIPAPLDSLQKRLNFIASAPIPSAATGG